MCKNGVCVCVLFTRVGGGGGCVCEALGIAAAAEARAVLFPDSIQLTPPLYVSLNGIDRTAFSDCHFVDVRKIV